MNQTNPKIKVRDDSILINLDEKLIETIKRYLDSLDVNVEKKKEIQMYLSNMNRNFIKHMKNNVQLMTVEELAVNKPVIIKEAVDKELEKRVKNLDAQLNAVAKRTQIFRKKYPKEVQEELEKQQKQIQELENFKKVIEDEKENKPIEEIEKEDTKELEDKITRSIQEVKKLVNTLPETNEQFLLVNELNRKRKEKFESPQIKKQKK